MAKKLYGRGKRNGRFIIEWFRIVTHRKATQYKNRLKIDVCNCLEMFANHILALREQKAGKIISYAIENGESLAMM
jgi:hypothetical protein